MAFGTGDAKIATVRYIARGCSRYPFEGIADIWGLAKSKACDSMFVAHVGEKKKKKRVVLTEAQIKRSFPLTSILSQRQPEKQDFERQESALKKSCTSG